MGNRHSIFDTRGIAIIVITAFLASIMMECSIEERLAYGTIIISIIAIARSALLAILLFTDDIFTKVQIRRIQYMTGEATFAGMLCTFIDIRTMLGILPGYKVRLAQVIQSLLAAIVLSAIGCLFVNNSDIIQALI